MNSVILMGRLTQDPEIRYANNGRSTCVARYTLAVDRPYRQNEDRVTDFIDCVAFGKSGEFAEKYLHKGMKMVVTGSIRTGSYTNRDGQKVRTTEVVVDHHEFCEKKNASNNSSPYTPTAMPAVDKDGFVSIPDGLPDDEELPFH